MVEERDCKMENHFGINHFINFGFVISINKNGGLSLPFNEKPQMFN